MQFANLIQSQKNLKTKQMDNLSKPSNDEVEILLFGGGVGECIVIHSGNNEWIIVDSFINTETQNPIA